MKHGWEIKKLGEVCLVLNGLWIGKKEPFINICVIRNTNFTKDCKLNLDNVAYIDAETKQFATRKLHVGDIIVEKSGGSEKQPVGRVVLFNVEDGDYSFSNFTSALRIKPEVQLNSSYLHKCLYAYYLKGETYKLQSKTTGLHNLDMKGYLRLPIPIPPLPEQERIVSELDCINGILEKKREQIKELDALAQSIFYHMFGDPVTNEKGWEVKKLGEVAEVGDGLHGTPIYDENGTIAFINGTNLIEGKVVITDKTLFVNEIEASKYRVGLGKNTVLLSINGTLGKTAIYRKEDVVLGKSACYCNLSTEYLNVNFVEKLMCADSFKRFLEDNSSKSTIKNVGLKTIRNFSIILPPLPLQQSFATKIAAIEKQKELIKRSIAEVETLLASRMQHYFG